MAETFDLILDDRGKLTLRRPCETDVADVRLRRSFPWSLPGRFVSVRNPSGKEILLIDDVQALPVSVRDRIEKYLSQTVLIPRIERIDSIDVRFGYQQWEVKSDRGPATFRVQEREDIRFLPDGRYSVKDADGNVYEMPALSAMDESSRTKLRLVI